MLRRFSPLSRRNRDGTDTQVTEARNRNNRYSYLKTAYEFGAMATGGVHAPAFASFQLNRNAGVSPIASAAALILLIFSERSRVKCSIQNSL
jgi:hypothetical protein